MDKSHFGLCDCDVDFNRCRHCNTAENSSDNLASHPRQSSQLRCAKPSERMMDDDSDGDERENDGLMRTEIR